VVRKEKAGRTMENLSAFLGYFLSYLILFAVFAVLVVVACIVGVKWRKSKDAKAALAGGSDAGAEE
jgi:hypothetical protein